MALERPQNLAGDLWGGLGAMLVAFPSAIAYGVTIFAPLGAAQAAQGAVAGILGATALGLIAPTFGGTNRLITAPCAPAAAVLAAFSLELARGGVPGEKALVMLTLVALLCGVLQLVFGFIGLGRLMKYMPYPVVSGYLSGVGLIIIGSQIPRFLGAPRDAQLWNALKTPSLWQWDAIIVGAVTVAVMLVAPRLTKMVPAAILGLAAGIATYFGLAYFHRPLLSLEGNALVVGPIAGAGASMMEAVVGRWNGLTAMQASDLGLLLTPALTLATLLSIDTLKTCIVLDAVTRSRHNSNRELVGQGLGNVAASAIGGIPGAGTMGATLVNISSGGQTRWSGLFEGVLVLMAFFILGGFIAWVPVAALAGILMVIGFKMFDRESLHLLRSRPTMLDFVVIVAVVVVAITVGLIAASAVGIALAILLFVREQVGGAVVRRKMYGNEIFSKHLRLPDEMEVLERNGDRTAIFELQGSLFFGTTDQLYSALEAELKRCKYLVLDLRRVQSVDVTAAHMLERVQDMMAERDGYVVFSHLPRNVPTGQDMQSYFDQVGLVRPQRHVHTTGELDEALEWVENRILEEERLERAQELPLELRDSTLFRSRKDETLLALEACMDTRSFRTGEKIFAHGEEGDELFLIRRGLVRVVLPLNGAGGHHLATFGRGQFFGEMAFLDRAPRSADAIAVSDVELFVLSRSRFEDLSGEHKRLAIDLLEGLARALAVRLRHADTELRTLQEN